MGYIKPPFPIGERKKTFPQFSFLLFLWRLMSVSHKRLQTLSVQRQMVTLSHAVAFNTNPEEEASLKRDVVRMRLR